MNFPLQGNWLDIVKGSAATLALFLAYLTLPVVGLLPGIFVPLPAVFYSLKNGQANGATIVAVSLAVLAVLTGVPTAALYILQAGIISLALAAFLDAGKGGARAIASSVALNVAVILLLALAYTLYKGVNLHQQMLAGINASISQAMDFYGKSGIKGDELKTMEQLLREGGAFIGRIYPALLLISLATVAGCNLLMVRRLAARIPRTLEVGELKEFRNPEQLIWALIAAGFAMLLDSRLVSDAALNVLVITLSFYFMQGLAIIIYFFERFMVPAGVRWFFYVFLALQPYLTVAVALLGIFDLWGNFRTPKQRENL
jgi:uncharacterized protein YybS (DUF2232 family)